MKIQAKVSQRIIKKADHFFTGKVGGRIVELLQNARRAGAKHTTITQTVQAHGPSKSGVFHPGDYKGFVTVRDDGEGVQNWEALLYLGESDWHHVIEDVEEPAGIGLFSLSPRPVTIRSQGKMVHIEGDGWFGAPLEVRDDSSKDRVDVGTSITFMDESWAEFEDGRYQTEEYPPPSQPRREIRRAAAFGDMNITFNGEAVEKRPFIDPSWESTHYPELGVRIAVINKDDLPEFHSDLIRHYAALNFYGQIVDDEVDDDFRVVPDRIRHGGYHRNGYCGYREEYVVLVDMTGEPTPLALMLPARTKLVKDGAFLQLKEACVREVLRYYSRLKEGHTLEYEWFVRARELGIEDFPEAVPIFSHGPVVGMMGNVEPWDGHRRIYGLNDNVLIPEDVRIFLHELPKDGLCGDVIDEENISEGHYFDVGDWGNAQLLSFIMGDPVDGEQQWMASVPGGYEQYSWAQGVHIADCLVVIPGELVIEGYFNDQTAYVVKDITMRLGLRDGAVHEASVDACFADSGDVYITESALRAGSWDVVKHVIWMTGGYNEDEAYEMEDRRCTEEWRSLEDGLVGEMESTRRLIVERVRELLPPYKHGRPSVVITTDDAVIIKGDGKKIIIKDDGSVTERPHCPMPGRAR